MFIETKLDIGAKYPNRAHPTDAGADLYSTETCTLAPGEQYMLDTGVALKIPEGYAGFIFNRSNQGKQGISIPNSVGVIDSDYRGSVKVILKNNSNSYYEILAGETRIAQLVILPVVLAEFLPSIDVANWNNTKRGTGGFGSTG